MPWRSIWFGLFILIYLSFLLSVYLTGGLTIITELSWMRMLQKTLLLAGPLEILYLWRKRNELIWVDYHMLYAPFLIWAMSFLAFGQLKGLSNAYVEMQVTALLLGLYFTRVAIVAHWPGVKGRKLALSLAGGVLFSIIILSRIIPPLPD